MAKPNPEYWRDDEEEFLWEHQEQQLLFKKQLLEEFLLAQTFNRKAFELELHHFRNNLFAVLKVKVVISLEDENQLDELKKFLENFAQQHQIDPNLN